MKFSLFAAIVLYLTTPVFLQGKFNIEHSINKFSINLLADVNKEGGGNVNIALSPLTIWTLLTIASEGAQETTADQIDRVLQQPPNKSVVRKAYNNLISQFKVKSKEAEFETSNGIFSRKEFPVRQIYSDIVKEFYNTNVVPVDFKNDNQGATNIINKYVAKTTRNRITNLINTGDVQNAYLFMTSTAYFKGVWQIPFNRSATRRSPFFDENKNQVGEVQLMYQVYPFPYLRHNNIRADIVELPYGFDDTFSMLLLVPRGDQTVINMLNSLNGESITDILERLESNSKKFPDDNIHVHLPKFKVTSDFNLDVVLQAMGITDIFDPRRANLLGMFKQYLYLSRFIQKAEIEVDELGTIATAAAGAIFENRTPPPIVKANRPFVFFIVHKLSRSVIFAGKISNPNDLG
ncbi:unnamed protein product [Ceutorhynchus assimilis]|uniref:Serpin domain-containing protein n=1 Tax=Ceutorhynchus assimilis TaxID=467358 RepID=A0A9N9MDW5_9CUCU|nr:unnamed protein product [Ceutorhynchus assimilis]